MYNESFLRHHQKQVTKHALALALPALGLMGLLVYSFFMRAEWLSVMLMTAMLSWLIFYGQVFFLPALRYAHFLADINSGKTSVTVGRFKNRSDSISTVDHLPFWAMTVNVGDKDAAEDDRLFYVDCAMDIPAVSLGQKVRISSYERFVVTMEPLSS